MLKIPVFFIFCITFANGQNQRSPSGSIIDPNQGSGSIDIPATTEEVIYFITTPYPDLDELGGPTPSSGSGKWAKRPVRPTDRPVYERTTDDYGGGRGGYERPTAEPDRGYYARPTTTPSSYLGRRTTQPTRGYRYTTSADDDGDSEGASTTNRYSGRYGGTTDSYVPSWKRPTTEDSFLAGRRTTWAPRPLTDRYQARFTTDFPYGSRTTQFSRYGGRSGSVTPDPSIGDVTNTCKISSQARFQFGRNICQEFIDCCRRVCSGQNLTPKGNCKHDTDSGFEKSMTYCNCRET